MLNEKELEIYYDHYKDTFLWLRKYLERRDKYFGYLILLIAVLYFNSWLRSDFEIIIKTLLSKKFGINGFSNFALIDSVLLFVVLSISIKYFQANLLIERQYSYLHHIEKRLSRSLTSFNIFREGKAYLSNYPLVLSFIHRIYTIVFPVFLILLVAIKWYSLVGSGINNSRFFMFDTIVCSLIIILTLLYLIWIHFRDFRKCKKVPNKALLANKRNYEEQP